MSSRSCKRVTARPGRANVSERSYQRSSWSRFSSRSATWSCISCAVAPGHAVTTVIAFTVNAGSSARPSRKNATTPAMEIRRMAKRVTDRSRTASAERLSPLTACPPLSRRPREPRPAPRRVAPAGPRGGRAPRARRPDRPPAARRSRSRFRRRCGAARWAAT